MNKPLNDPNADPLAKERGSKAWTARRRALALAGGLGALAFAIGAFSMGGHIAKGPAEPTTGLAAQVSD